MKMMIYDDDDNGDDDGNDNNFYGNDYEFSKSKKLIRQWYIFQADEIKFCIM